MSGLSKVLIGGGSGFIGRRLCLHLQQEGFQPIILSRNPGKDRMTWIDLYQKGLPQNCKAVVNLSGENIGNPFRRFNDEFKSDLYDSRVGTTKQLVDAILKSQNPPDVFVGASAIGYYKPDDSARYTEESVCEHGQDFISRMVLDWEAASQPLTQTDVRHVTVRIGLVLGREGGLINQLYLPFLAGLGGRIGSGDQWMPWIHVDDIVGIFTHAIKHQHVTGTLNGVAPHCVSNQAFVRALARAMNRPALLPMPAFVLNALFGQERGEMMTSGAYVIPKRTLESGYKYVYESVEEACVDCAKFFVDPRLMH